MAALPPLNNATPPEFDEEPQGGEELSPPPGFRFIEPEEQDFTEWSWELAKAFAAFLAFAAIGAYVAMLCWNNLTAVTTLVEIDWRQAFAAIVLLRIVGWATAR